jgi:predicted dienelactone hydrolase
MDRIRRPLVARVSGPGSFGATLALLLAACGSSLPFEPAGPEAAPDPASPGPYPVGVRTLWLTDPDREDPYGGDGGRRFRVEVWYPAVAEAARAPRDVVDLFAEAPPEVQTLLEGTEVPTISQDAARDAEPYLDDAPYPVILFSHGNGGIRTQSVSYTVHLASHGYLVLAPDHVGNLLYDMLDTSDVQSSAMDSIFERPEDLRLILDRLADGSFDPSGVLAPLADLSRVGVTGHSLGGLTSLYVSQPDQDAYDARYRVAVPITPATSVLDLLAAPVEGVTIPLLYVGATADATLSYEKETLAAYDLATQDKAVAGVVGAGHFSFTEVCRFDLSSVAAVLGMTSDVADLLDDGCGPQNIPVERAHTLNDWYGAAWFNVYLRGSEGTASTYLDPSAAPADVEYAIDRPGQHAPR